MKKFCVKTKKVVENPHCSDCNKKIICKKVEEQVETHYNIPAEDLFIVISDHKIENTGIGILQETPEILDPFEGQGGTFAGGGASGDYSTPDEHKEIISDATETSVGDSGPILPIEGQKDASEPQESATEQAEPINSEDSSDTYSESGGSESSGE